ncbi:MFS transporter [Thalassococcus lentus]|uniref:MFS transporter n=1 Tax=Thalassococcus lentus TaxID=1210524 RepID=A0ABT4XSZ4_9RHOB|nr:MFS transporter [Thalassococcus lentus]MDA7425073.1 MFS transporter [Thalassococcus lentus]
MNIETQSPQNAGAAWPLIAVLSACNFVIGMGAFMVVGMIEPLADGLGVSVATVGGLMTIYALGYAILSPLLVSLSGSIGRRRVLAFGLSVFVGASLLAAVFPVLGALYLLRIIAAAGAGLVTPVTSAIAAGLSAPQERGKTLAAVFFGLTLAQVLGIPVGSWIAYTYGWRIAFVMVALLGLPCIWLVWTRVPAGLTFAPTSLRDLGGVLRDPVLMGSTLFTASFLGAIYVLFTYIPPLLAQEMGLGRNGIAAVLLVFGAAAVVGNLGGGWLSDRIGAVRTLALLCCGQIALMPVFSALPLPFWTVLTMVFFWSGMGWSFAAPQQMRLVTMAPDKAPVLLALNAAAIYIGIAIGSAVGGVVISIAGLTALGAVAGILMLGALAHLLWSHRAANIRRSNG